VKLFVVLNDGIRSCYAKPSNIQDLTELRTGPLLMKQITLHIEQSGLDFAQAKRIAEQRALDADENAMLLAWSSRDQGKVSPEVQECTGDQPGWRAYAESHGGNIEIDINDGDYVFIYATVNGD